MDLAVDLTILLFLNPWAVYELPSGAPVPPEFSGYDSVGFGVPGYHGHVQYVLAALFFPAREIIIACGYHASVHEAAFAALNAFPFWFLHRIFLTNGYLIVGIFFVTVSLK